MNKHPRLTDDWFHGDIPANVEVGRDVHIDSAHAFASCLSRRTPGVVLEEGCGVYYPADISVAPNGVVRVGAYSCLNGNRIVCHELISIGAHCLISWGVVLTDSEPTATATLRERKGTLASVAGDPERCLPPVGKVRPVTLEDNVWIGFESVVLPGVTIGRGCIVGCKSIVAEDLPPYSIAVGNPAHVVRHLEPSDTEAARQKAFRECLRA